MPAKDLPSRANLANLRKQAKTLLRAFKDGDTDAVDRIQAADLGGGATRPSFFGARNRLVSRSRPRQAGTAGIARCGTTASASTRRSESGSSRSFNTLTSGTATDDRESDWPSAGVSSNAMEDDCRWNRSVGTDRFFVSIFPIKLIARPRTDYSSCEGVLFYDAPHWSGHESGFSRAINRGWAPR